MRLGRGLSLLGVLETDDAALGTGNRTTNQYNSQFVIDHHDLEVLYRHELVAHATRHLLAGHNSTTTTLRGTRCTDCSVVLGVTVRSFLTGEAVALHTTSETHTPRSTLDIDILALLEPIGQNLNADGQQTILVSDLKLGELSLGCNALGLVVTQQWAGNVSTVTRTLTNLHSPVAVLLSSLVGDDLDLIELQNSARHTNLSNKHTRHALLNSENSRS
ncbi:hypothetical protein HG531_012672 [Fusarium graminearum]|nr:hypothetical protein HG531_012672 [Fusarium graminearum]